MRSTFYGFEIAKSGLYASQQNLNITGHNIANVNTPGYSRQRLNVSSIPAPFYSGLVGYSDTSASGQGVKMLYVDQIRNPFLDAKFRQENTSANNWVTKDYEFSMVEALFNNEITEDASGVSAVFKDFYAAIHKFAENTVDKDPRQALLQSALTLTESMNNNAKKLNDQYNNIDESIKSTVTQINMITKSIAELNNTIVSYEMSGAQANDLRDKRNSLIDELSGIIPINYKTSDKGYMTIEFNGKELVNHATSNNLAVSKGGTDPAYDHAFADGARVNAIYWETDLDATGAPNAGATAVYTNEGSLGGYLQMRDGTSEGNVGIPYVMNMLNELCLKVAMEFNATHVDGWGIPEGGAASTTGNKFFDDGIALQRDADGNITGYWKKGEDPAVDPVTAGNPYDDPAIFKANCNVTAMNFGVNQDIKDNVYLIAGSDTKIDPTATNDEKGNNKNALKLVELLTKTNVAGNPDNFDSVYKNILVTVGLKMSEITRNADSQTSVLESVHNQRGAIMNVSLDEEITNVVKYGHSYNAASRVITAIDEQLDVIINRMGMVGR